MTTLGAPGISWWSTSSRPNGSDPRHDTWHAVYDDGAEERRATNRHHPTLCLSAIRANGSRRQTLDANSGLKICTLCCIAVLNRQSASDSKFLNTQPEPKRWWLLLRVQIQRAVSVDATGMFDQIIRDASNLTGENIDERREAIINTLFDSWAHQTLKPLWWCIDDHDGRDFATADEQQYTIALGAPVEAVNIEDATVKLTDQRKWFEHVIGDAPAHGYHLPKLRRIEIAERAVEFWGKEYDAALAEERANDK